MAPVRLVSHRAAVTLALALLLERFGFWAKVSSANSSLPTSAGSLSRRSLNNAGWGCVGSA